MAKFRSPVLGFNHNIRHNGWLFHVQTEDSGAQNPHIYTHLFNEGVIVASKKLDYDPEADVEIIKTLMQAQHKAVMKELKHGAFDDKIRAYLGEIHKGDKEKIALEGVSAPVEAVAPAAAEPVPVMVDEQAEATPKQPSVHPDISHVDEEAPTLPPPAPKQPPAPPVAAAAQPAAPVAAPPDDASAASSTPYAQIVVSDEQQPAVVSGVLNARETALDDDDEINGLLSRLKEDSVDEPLPEADRNGTWIVSRPGQKERPFDKTGPIAIPIPVQREEVARRVMSPTHLPEVPPPPRTRKMTMPQVGGASSANPAAPRRPTPPPTQVNPQGRPSGQYSTVRPAPTRVSGSISTANPKTGTNPPITPKPPTIPPARPITPPPVTASGTGSVSGPGPATPRTQPPAPPRSPISQVSPPVLPPNARPPVPPGRSQAVPPVPPIAASGPRASVQIAPPPRGISTTTGPLRSQNVVPPTPPPSRPVPPRPTPAARSQPVAVVSPAARRPPPSEGVVVARPAVVIGAPPTVIGGAPEAAAVGRRVHGREPTPPPTQPESIFGQDLISEKSLDEVIMAYLSEDSNED